MKTPMSHTALSIRTIQSSNSTPQSSTYPSAYPSEDEDESENPSKTFKFLELPSELRNKVYEHHFIGAPSVIDLDPDNFKNIHRKFLLFLVSKQVHEEASHYFYATHTIRLFPIHPGRFFKTKKPLLARLPPRYRESITSLQLRLGPGFNAPPRGWVVNDQLGLADIKTARVLEVFVQVDTSDPIFKGFRKDDDGFYEKFSGNLLNEVLISVPSIVEVQLDAYSSVHKDGKMMTGLIQIANRHKKLISWGPERGWREDKDIEWAESYMSLAKPTLPSQSEVSVVS
jgi:hypothetical protein